MPTSRPKTLTTLAALAMTAVALAACSSNATEVPQPLLDAIKKQNTAGYPAGPYGSRVGDVVQNLCFSGWKDPKAAAYAEAELAPICLGDFHDDKAARLLLVESCAIWCAACRSEYGGNGTTQPSLAQRLDERKSHGFRVLGTIFQDAESKPATPADAATWASTYSLEFPFAVDQDHKLGLFTSSVVAPFNLLIDTRTMKIVLELQGDEPSVLFSAADDFLNSTEAP
ncbi:MAG TPA: hypothetical protein VF395_20460 [Polyangiaceae bacterium]